MKIVKEQKRLYRRFNLNGKVDFNTGRDRKEKICAYLDNISLGGLGLLSEEKVPLNKRVNFNLNAAEAGQVLSGRGRVRHVTMIKKYGNDFFYIGVKFDNVRKEKVKVLIKKAYRLRKKSYLSKRVKKDLFLIFKITPIFMLASLLLSVSFSKMSAQAAEERRAIRELEKAAVYFLYHHTHTH